MSHLPERKEKICLNCKSVIYGRFCHLCGQENVEPKETLWHLITHFVYDITHFDGKFFSTLKLLLFKPGYLSCEYIRGRRAAYLNPIRMYIFTSAFFFILFFALISGNEEEKEEDIQIGKQELLSQKKKIVDSLAVTNDSLTRVKLEKRLVNINKAIRFLDQNGLLKFNFGDVDSDTSTTRNKVFGDFGMKMPNTLKEYDSLQKVLHVNKKDNWLKRSFKRRVISINERYAGSPNLFWERMKDKWIHSIPQMMFVSLPLVALLFQMLYVRKRKQFFYVSHAIFTVHIYIAIYMLILLSYAFGGMRDLTGWGIFSFIAALLVFLIFFYVYKAMRNFYQQRRAKTVFKYFLILFLFFFVMSIIMLVYAFTSAFTL